MDKHMDERIDAIVVHGAPQVIVPKKCELWHRLGKKTTVYVNGFDVVPRLPSCHENWKEIIEDYVATWSREKTKVLEIRIDELLKKWKAWEYLWQMGDFRHVGKLIFIQMVKDTTECMMVNANGQDGKDNKGWDILKAPPKHSGGFIVGHHSKYDKVLEAWAVLEAVKKNGLALQFASTDLRNKREIVLEAVKNNGVALEYASTDLRNKREIVLEAVKNNGLALEYASKDLQKDREIVLEAVKNNGYALECASKDLKKGRGEDAKTTRNVEAFHCFTVCIWAILYSYVAAFLFHNFTVFMLTIWHSKIFTDCKDTTILPNSLGRVVTILSSSLSSPWGWVVVVTFPCFPWVAAFLFHRFTVCKRAILRSYVAAFLFHCFNVFACALSCAVMMLRHSCFSVSLFACALSWAVLWCGCW
jgi:hypothetical protein